MFPNIHQSQREKISRSERGHKDGEDEGEDEPWPRNTSVVTVLLWSLYHKVNPNTTGDSAADVLEDERKNNVQ